MALLKRDEVEAELATLEGWAVRGGRILKEFSCGDFAGSIAFAGSILPDAEALGHHPDLEISWDTVKVTVTTHSEGGLTAADFELARAIDRRVGGQDG